MFPYVFNQSDQFSIVRGPFSLDVQNKSAPPAEPMQKQSFVHIGNFPVSAVPQIDPHQVS